MVKIPNRADKCIEESVQQATAQCARPEEGFTWIPRIQTLRTLFIMVSSKPVERSAIKTTLPAIAVRASWNVAKKKKSDRAVGSKNRIERSVRARTLKLAYPRYNCIIFMLSSREHSVRSLSPTTLADLTCVRIC